MSVASDWLRSLIEIARALSQERDIDRLLGLILEKSRYVTDADAGSIYVVEGEGDERRLRFKLSQNDSVGFESSEFVMPVSTRSIAGAAVVTGKPIGIADVYKLPANVPYGFDRSFDERVGYRTVSMLAMPMISAEDEVIGVIQLINRKRTPEQPLRKPEDFEREVVAFDATDEELAASLAAQAGIALENARLYDEIRKIFEGFVRASVHAIEQRDPTTSGHSQRVSVLSCSLAEKVDRIGEGPYRDARFSVRDMRELEYAALLHDFGKIGVREQVLLKAKKLHPQERDAIRARIDFARKSAEVELLGHELREIERGSIAGRRPALEGDVTRRRERLDRAWELIERANEPTVLNEGDFSLLEEIAQMRYLDPDGVEKPLLTAAEVASLSVRKGSLSDSEMDEIRSHVVHTTNFLRQIPWGKSMRRIPAIAGAHHERLDGTGYPKGLHSEGIPLASKIMSVADIYDALTARDRPYKRALPPERALEILGYEVRDGHIDPELVRIFREAGVYRATEVPVGS